MKPIFKRLSTWTPLIIAASLCIGLWFGSRFFGQNRDDAPYSLEKLQLILNQIGHNYVDSLDIDSLVELTLPDLMAKLDPHSTYIPASDIDVYNEDIEGSFSGIGIRFNTMSDTIMVDEVISGGPCEKVGLLPGDRIITVDDTIIAGAGWTNERIIKKLRGPKGSEVNLGVKRANAPELLRFTVVRDDIPVSSIDASYMLTPRTGYVKINKFAQGTYGELLTALVDLRSQGANGYVLDLRGNGGGLLQSAIDIANEFLPRDAIIVSTRGRTDQYMASAVANGLGSFLDDDLIVLIDETSASASEILAGAVQDNDRGTVIGRRSFGKGLVQEQIPLPDNSAIRLTVARYYTPSGRCIQKSYTRGNLSGYAGELAERYLHGEGFSADSIKIDRSQTFHTIGGREVFGGGGIVPDIFVANDTLGISDYYIRVFNAGMLQKFAFSFTDRNRPTLSECTTVPEILDALPSDDALLSEFVSYCQREARIAPRWFYINQSRDLIVSILKALIARDVLGTQAYYEVINQSDPVVGRAIEELDSQKEESVGESDKLLSYVNINSCDSRWTKTLFAGA